jgi:hypothetical protein
MKVNVGEAKAVTMVGFMLVVSSGCWSAMVSKKISRCLEDGK